MTKVDLKEQLRFLLRAISRDCTSYDEGVHEAALLISIPARTIFHKTGKSTPILEKLAPNNWRSLEMQSHLSEHQKRAIDMPSTVYSAGLFMIGNGRAMPKLADGLPPIVPRVIPAEDWWTENFYRSQDITINRMQLCLAVANKLVAHADGRIPDNYAELVHSPQSEVFLSGLKMIAGLGFAQVMDIRLSEDAPAVHMTILRTVGDEILSSPGINSLTL